MYGAGSMYRADSMYRLGRRRAVFFDFLDVVMLLDGVDADSGSVAHFRSGEGSGGSAGDAACDRSGGGWDAFGLQLIVLLRVSGFDLGFGLGVRDLRGC